MLVLMASPDAVLRNGQPDPDIAGVLIEAKANGNPVGLISNKSEPSWFQSVFQNTGVQFLQVRGRQKGGIVAENANKLKLEPYDVLVLAAKDEDIHMGKNGGAVIVAAGWSNSNRVADLGIRVDDAQQLKEIIELMSQWNGQWWFTGDSPGYGVRALCDLSGLGKGVNQQQFGARITKTVKNGGVRLNALLGITARSLLSDGLASRSDLLWGVYPSSSSANADQEVLSDFTHRLRTTVSRVRFSKRDEPLFIRHAPSTKRSAGSGGDRTDPTDQILTLHLNPFYSGKVAGRNVILTDDCTTYGVSFGVAAAFLKRAGAASVVCVALGKFGNQLRHYNITVTSDPFAPIPKDGFKVTGTSFFQGETNTVSQKALLNLL